MITGLECSEKIDLTISHIVADLLKSSKRNGFNGLLSGRMGAILLIAEYYNSTKSDECFIFIQKELEAIFDDISNGNINSTSLANGLTGILLGIFLLKKYDLIDLDAEELLIFNNMLNSIMVSNFKDQKNDYLHSSLGILYYFTFTLKDYPDNLTSINNAIAEIYCAKKTYGNGFYWSNEMPAAYDNSGINLGLSHGQASMLSVLCFLTKEFNERGIKSSMLNEMLNGIVNLFEGISEDIMITPGRFSFPDWIREEHQVPSTRLAWCYGDLSTVFTLMKAASLLNKGKLYERCVEILLNTTTITYEDSGVIDAGFCHGASGVAYMYQKCYEFTLDKAFLDASRRWGDVTMNLAIHKEGTGGFKSFFGDRWLVCTDLLDGASGIGLVLLSIKNKKSSFFLDNCLLLK